MNPDPVLVRAQLDRILASPEFSSAGRHSRLLRYLVERTLAGDGEQLKEYVLGTEVFDRADSYDPRLDSIVRVEARRLRTRLDDYYRGHGANDQLIIAVPTGSYLPVFSERSAPIPAAEVAVPRSRPYGPATFVAAITVAAVLIATALAIYSNRTPAQASTESSIAVLPFEHFSTREEDAKLVAQMTHLVTAELARLGRLSVASTTSATRYSSGTASVPAIATALDVDYLLEASVVITGQQLHLVVRLVDGRRDRKMWVSEYDARSADLSSAARQIAVATADAVQRTVQNAPR
jgi:adenylate cyclase